MEDYLWTHELQPISRCPINDASRLQQAFAEILHSSSLPGYRMHTWGRYLELCVPRIGTSDVLDRAVICLILGHRARFTSDLKTKQRSRREYGSALTLLREVVGEEEVTVGTSAIAATKLLMAYE